MRICININGGDHMPMRGTNRSGQRRSALTAFGCGRGTSLLLLTIGLVANVAGCSDPGIVTAQTDLQQAPASGSKVLAVIPKGSAITVGDCSNGWCRVSWNGHDGYVLTKSMRLAEGAHREIPEANQPPLYGDDDTTAAPDVPPVPLSSPD
jgi:hypothetical protein